MSARAYPFEPVGEARFHINDQIRAALQEAFWAGMAAEAYVDEPDLDEWVERFIADHQKLDIPSQSEGH